MKRQTHRNTDRLAGRHRLDQRDVTEGGTAAQRDMQMDHELHGKWEAEMKRHCCKTDRQTDRQTDGEKEQPGKEQQQKEEEGMEVWELQTCCTRVPA